MPSTHDPDDELDGDDYDARDGTTTDDPGGTRTGCTSMTSVRSCRARTAALKSTRKPNSAGCGMYVTEEDARERKSVAWIVLMA